MSLNATALARLHFNSHAEWNSKRIQKTLESAIAVASPYGEFPLYMTTHADGNPDAARQLQSLYHSKDKEYAQFLKEGQAVAARRTNSAPPSPAPAPPPAARSTTGASGTTTPPPPRPPSAATRTNRGSSSARTATRSPPRTPTACGTRPATVAPAPLEQLPPRRLRAGEGASPLGASRRRSARPRHASPTPSAWPARRPTRTASSWRPPSSPTSATRPASSTTAASSPSPPTGQLITWVQ
mmetsp:Transcript_31618/g.80492  ORF Transcript_31618/g.80492 Transcript_31618/m.80492 type:complete len:241 (+) Transcript_31618:149-871(+)